MFNSRQMELKVASLEDMRFTLMVWQDLVYELSKQEREFDPLLYRRVTAAVDDRLPDNPVHLHFIAPEEMLLEFRQILEDRGFVFSRQTLVPGMIYVYQMHSVLHG